MIQLTTLPAPRLSIFYRRRRREKRKRPRNYTRRQRRKIRETA